MRNYASPHDISINGRDGGLGNLARQRRARDCKKAPPDAGRRLPTTQYLNMEKSISFWVMNSSRAGVPAWVCSMPRLMAGMISEASVTRSP